MVEWDLHCYRSTVPTNFCTEVLYHIVDDITNDMENDMAYNINEVLRTFPLETLPSPARKSCLIDGVY